MSIDKNKPIKELPSYDDYNFHVFSGGRQYVVKCYHAELVTAAHVELPKYSLKTPKIKYDDKFWS